MSLISVSHEQHHSTIKHAQPVTLTVAELLVMLESLDEISEFGALNNRQIKLRVNIRQQLAAVGVVNL